MSQCGIPGQFIGNGCVSGWLCSHVDGWDKIGFISLEVRDTWRVRIQRKYKVSLSTSQIYIYKYNIYISIYMVLRKNIWCRPIGACRGNTRMKGFFTGDDAKILAFVTPGCVRMLSDAPTTVCAGLRTAYVLSICGISKPWRKGRHWPAWATKRLCRGPSAQCECSAIIHPLRVRGAERKSLARISLAISRRSGSGRQRK